MRDGPRISHSRSRTGVDALCAQSGLRVCYRRYRRPLRDSRRRILGAYANERIVSRPAAAAAGCRPLAGKVGRIPGRATPGRDHDLVGFALRDAARLVASRAHDVNAVGCRGRGRGLTCGSGGTGRPGLALRPRRALRAGITFRALGGLAARRQGKSKDQTQGTRSHLRFSILLHSNDCVVGMPFADHRASLRTKAAPVR